MCRMWWSVLWIHFLRMKNHWKSTIRPSSTYQNFAHTNILTSLLTRDMGRKSSMQFLCRIHFQTGSHFSKYWTNFSFRSVCLAESANSRQARQWNSFCVWVLFVPTMERRGIEEHKIHTSGLNSSYVRLNLNSSNRLRYLRFKMVFLHFFKCFILLSLWWSSFLRTSRRKGLFILRLVLIWSVSLRNS